jgi:hypothetical protein
MKDATFYIEKTDELIKKVNEFKETNFVEKMRVSILPLINETEMLFYGYSENFPLLVDLRLIKEGVNSWIDLDGHKSDRLLQILSQFKSFIQDYRS